MRNSRKESILLLVGLTLLILLTGNFFQGIIFAQTADKFERLEWFADAFDKIDRQYVDPIPSQTLIEGAIEGMTEKLDSHSTFLSTEHLKELEEDTSGEYVGIGIRIFQDVDKLVTVDSTFPGAPAFREGILAGDKIISVDGTSTRDMTTSQVRDLIRGPRGTTVAIGIYRPPVGEGRGEQMVKTVLREKIDVSSVDKAEIIAPGIGYIRIKEFSDQTIKDLRRELGKMSRKKITGLVIDLRWNPGGLLRSAIDVSDLFLPKGQVVVSTKGRVKGQNREWRAQTPDHYPNVKLALVVNEFSASASEIVSGALHDTGRARLFGTKTYGKGSVQTVIELKNHTAIKLTTARYYTPNGTSIEKSKGIVPDTVVPFDRDQQTRLIEQMRIKENGGMAKLVEKQQKLENVARYTEKHVADVVEKLYDDKASLDSVRKWLSGQAEHKYGDGTIEDVQLDAAIAWLQGKEVPTTAKAAGTAAAK